MRSRSNFLLPTFIILLILGGVFYTIWNHQHQVATPARTYQEIAGDLPAFVPHYIKGDPYRKGFCDAVFLLAEQNLANSYLYGGLSKAELNRVKQDLLHPHITVSPPGDGDTFKVDCSK